MKGLHSVSKYLGLGFQIAGAILIPVLIGVYVDSVFNITPLGVIAGSIFGFAGLFAFIYKLSIELSRTNEKPDKKSNP